MQLYVLEAGDLDNAEGVSDAEFEKFFEDARLSITSQIDEEEKKQKEEVLHPAIVKGLAKADDFILLAKNFKGFR